MAVLFLAIFTAALSQPREPGVSRDRTDQLRALGDPGPVPSKREREVLRQLNGQQKEWKRSFERDWKAYRKSEHRKPKTWTGATPEERAEYQNDRRRRGLPPVPEDLMRPIRPKA